MLEIITNIKIARVSKKFKSKKLEELTPRRNNCLLVFLPAHRVIKFVSKPTSYLAFSKQAK